MSPENFVFWLNGFLELTEQEQIGSKQMTIIKDHIALVLKKETPTYAKGGFIPPATPGTYLPIYHKDKNPMTEVKYLDIQGSC